MDLSRERGWAIVSRSDRFAKTLGDADARVRERQRLNSIPVVETRLFHGIEVPVVAQPPVNIVWEKLGGVVFRGSFPQEGLTEAISQFDQQIHTKKP